MVEFIRLKTTEGTPEVVNLDHVIHIQELGPNNAECVIHLSNSTALRVPMSASQVLDLAAARLAY